MKSELNKFRCKYHKMICDNILGYRINNGKKTNCLSVADGSSQTSKMFAEGIVEQIGNTLCPDPPRGQTAGSLFAQYTSDFLESVFKMLLHVRPGKWSYSTSQNSIGIAAYSQYSYLFDLQNLLKNNKEIQSALGGNYLITPDIVVSRYPLTDEEINKNINIVDIKDVLASHTRLRKENFAPSLPILHASISCKWSMRSDRAQNTRTEALNLIRNRKGKTPIICAVTMEPLPSRLASIALGTGDIDCTYHAALHELLESVKQKGSDDQIELIHTMIQGERLKDISDLPFDLAI